MHGSLPPAQNDPPPKLPFWNPTLIKRVSICSYKQQAVYLLLRRHIPDIVFQRLEGKKASRIKLEVKTSPGLNSLQEDRENIIKWYCDNMKHFYNVLWPVWKKVHSKLK
jgi:hypothetical protein